MSASFYCFDTHRIKFESSLEVLLKRLVHFYFCAFKISAHFGYVHLLMLCFGGCSLLKEIVSCDWVRYLPFLFNHVNISKEKKNEI